MNVYLDMCCLKRAWDDQTQPRIAVETAALTSIFNAIHDGRLTALRSIAHDLENALNPDADRARTVAEWLSLLAPPTNPDEAPSLAGRLDTLNEGGLKGFDAYHLAWAEVLQADWLITTDDRFAQRALRLQSSVRIVNPAMFVEDQKYDDSQPG